ncbi:hypothetical protein ABW636_08275 [Aquimarina sp. 2201CG1-2-11]|uniref:hypothetical protein n=1 Tax=Aquimarina discodermiae TaxID=3231043 RepID=UPI0034637671
MKELKLEEMRVVNGGSDVPSGTTSTGECFGPGGATGGGLGYLNYYGYNRF